MRIDPEPQDFDPETFDAAALLRAFQEGVQRFDAGDYHEAHEAFERCWLASEAGDAEFHKGLIQASICMHHLVRGNAAGARPLHSGARRLLGPFLPEHRGVDLERFLSELQAHLHPVLSRRAEVPDSSSPAPRLGPLGGARS